MKRLFLILFAITALSASAQSLFVKAGLGFASQWGSPGVSGGSKISFGYEYEFSQTFAFAPSIGITGRGWQVDDVSTPDMLFDDDGNMLDALGHITTVPSEQAQRPVLNADGEVVPGEYMYSMMHRSYAANYLQLDLPFNYYHRVAPASYITLTAGPWVACGFAGNRSTKGDGRACGGDKVRYSDRTFALPGARRLDAGLKFGVGYQFPSSLTINLEGDFGLLPTNDITGTSALDDAFGFRAGRNVSLMLTFTYKLNKSTWREDE